MATQGRQLIRDRKNMKHTGFITGTLIVALAVSAGAAYAKGAGKFKAVEFEALDADGNGELSQAELDAHRAARFATADSNGDGVLSLQELQAAGHTKADERAARMIERFDANADGALSQDEMPGPRKQGRMFTRMDADGNGTISQEEFAQARDRMKERHGGKRKHGGLDRN